MQHYAAAGDHYGDLIMNSPIVVDSSERASSEECVEREEEKKKITFGFVST